MASRVVDRSEWGARNGRGDRLTIRPVPRVVIHHTFRPDLTHGLALEQVARHVQAIEAHHVRTNGWAAIGYNWLVDQDGRIYEGRGWGRVGAHAPGVNSSSVGVAFLIDGSARRPTEQAWRAVEWLIREGVRLGEITSPYILTGHRDHKDTSCPGNLIYSELGRLRGLSVDPLPAPAITPRTGERRWSGYLNDFVILTRYVSDAEWYFVTEGTLSTLGARASSPWSHMPRAKP